MTGVKYYKDRPQFFLLLKAHNRKTNASFQLHLTVKMLCICPEASDEIKEKLKTEADMNSDVNSLRIHEEWIDFFSFTFSE